MQSFNNYSEIIRLGAIINIKFSRDYFDTLDFPDNLNKTDVKCMNLIENYRPENMSHLSRMLMLEKGSFTSVAKKIIEKGYAKKVHDENDKRICYLQLTPKGKELVEDITKNHLEYIESVIDEFDIKDKERFLELTHELYEMFRNNLSLEK